MSAILSYIFSKILTFVWPVLNPGIPKRWFLFLRNKTFSSNGIIVIISEVYSESSRTSKIELFVKIVNPICPVNPDRKMLLTWNLAQSYFAMLQTNWLKKFQNIGDDVTNYVNFLKNYAKNGWNMFFSKTNLVTARKKIFNIFFQLLNVKITHKLNIYRLIC